MKMVLKSLIFLCFVGIQFAFVHGGGGDLLTLHELAEKANEISDIFHNISMSLPPKDAELLSEADETVQELEILIGTTSDVAQQALIQVLIDVYRSRRNESATSSSEASSVPPSSSSNQNSDCQSLMHDGNYLNVTVAAFKSRVELEQEISVWLTSLLDQISAFENSSTLLGNALDDLRKIVTIINDDIANLKQLADMSSQADDLYNSIIAICTDEVGGRAVSFSQAAKALIAFCRGLSAKLRKKYNLRC